jgi:UDP-3-O-[3-hydroxymyristoyl] glucosamine N-acyltransferase|tara:strand:+ start:1073 stop:1654 length:582 start_codon:yes stop_codon:yes gene_type:complete
MSKKMDHLNKYIDPNSVVDSKAIIGDGTSVWCYAHIREDVNVGKNCNIGNGVYLDKGVKVGNNVSIQNKTLVYRNTIIQDDVFVGPNVVFTNDRNPRSGVIRDLTGISWSIGKGSSIGASSTIMSDINIGKYAMVGANSLVTKDVPNHGLVYGSPAKLMGYVCKCGMKFEKDSFTKCKKCEMEIDANGKIIQE